MIFHPAHCACIVWPHLSHIATVIAAPYIQLVAVYLYTRVGRLQSERAQSPPCPQGSPRALCLWAIYPMVRSITPSDLIASNQALLTRCVGLTEEQITEIFSGAGRVLNFRLVYDRETGRPKGFGFAEFPDYGAQFFTIRAVENC